MKQLVSIFAFVALLFASQNQLFAQIDKPPMARICTNFEGLPVNTAGVNNIGHWMMYNDHNGGVSSPAVIKVATGGNPGNAITASDVQGSTHLINARDFSGNWLEKGCFCFDIKLISDGAATTLPKIKHGINIFQNLKLNLPLSPSNATIRFSFVLHNSYDENSGWQPVCLPIKLVDANNSADPLPSNKYGQWVASANLGGMSVNAAWNNIIQNVTEVGFFVDVTSANQAEVIGLDNICLGGCEPPRPKYCCPGDNLIKNGTFNAGNVGFTSGYAYDGSTTPSSCPPGEYNVVTGPDATYLNAAWQVQAPTCSPFDKFLLVNGNTTGTSKLVWKTTVPVKAWGKYKFCFNVKNLSDAKPPKIEVKFPGSGLPGLDPSFHDINFAAGPCVYQTVNRAVDLWGTATGNVLNIEIWLNENPSTAPNDLAFDNIALIEVPQCPVASAKFDFKTIDAATYYNVEATALINGPCTATWWEVCEIDPNTLTVVAGSKVSSDTKNWWTTVMTFNGYFNISNNIPGQFQYGKLYRITRGTWGDCNAWNSYAMYVASSLTLRKSKFYAEEAVTKNKSLIQEMMKSK